MVYDKNTCKWHALFHRYRGDPYHNMIYPSQEYLDTHQEELLLGGD